MRAAEAYQLDAQRRGPETAHQFAKNPATWLNAECWDDEPAKPIATTYSQPESPHIARAARIARQLQAEQGGDNVE